MSPEEKKILNLLYISPYNWKGTKGWLVKFRYYPEVNGERSRRNSKETSKQFTVKRYGTHDKALEAARKWRDAWIEEHKEDLWLRAGGEYSVTLPKNNTSGIVGVNRTTRKLPGGSLNEAWQSSIPRPGAKHNTAKFAVQRHGEIGALVLAIRSRRDGLQELLDRSDIEDDPSLPELIAYYSDLLANIEDLRDMTPGRSIGEIVSDPSTDGTSKFEEICLRVGHHKFRRQVLEHFEEECAVTGSKVLIRASHIKPWRVADDQERLDPMNGLALSPVYDAAFDRGMITFRADGLIMIRSDFESDSNRLGISPDDRIARLCDGHRHYLDWHQKHLFSPNQQGEQDGAGQPATRSESK